MLVEKIQILNFIIQPGAQDPYYDEVIKECLVDGNYDKYGEDFKKDVNMVIALKTQFEALELTVLDGNMEKYRTLVNKFQRDMLAIMEKYTKQLDFYDFLRLSKTSDYIKVLYVLDAIKDGDFYNKYVKIPEGEYELDITEYLSERFKEDIEILIDINTKYDTRFKFLQNYFENVYRPMEYRYSIAYINLQELLMNRLLMDNPKVNVDFDGNITPVNAITAYNEVFTRIKKLMKIIFNFPQVETLKLLSKHKNFERPKFRNSATEKFYNYLSILEGMAVIRETQPALISHYNSFIELIHSPSDLREFETGMGFAHNPKNFSKEALDYLSELFTRVYENIRNENSILSLLDYMGKTKYEIINRLDPRLKSKLLKSMVK